MGRLKDGKLRLKSPRLIFRLLFPNVLLHLFQLVAHGRDRITPRSEMGACEVLQLSTNLSGNRNGTVPFQEADTAGHRELGQDLDTQGEIRSSSIRSSLHCTGTTKGFTIVRMHVF